MSSKVGKDIAINGDGAVALAWKQMNHIGGGFRVAVRMSITPQTLLRFTVGATGSK